MRNFFLMIGLLGTILHLSASDLEFNGFIDTYHAVRLKGQNEFNASRTRFRGEIFSQIEDASLFVSFNAISNNILKNETGIELREAFVEYVASKWDMRVGRQIITWGKADGMQITDIICSGDYTEFITRDFDDIRIPVESIKFRWLPGFADFEMIWLPFFKASVLPSGNNPWKISQAYNTDNEIVFKQTIEPENKLKNSEIAGKISLYLSGIDLAFSGFYTWDDLPIIHEQTVNDTTHLQPEHHRLKYLGMEMNKPIGDFVVRSEIAFYQNKFFRNLSADDRKDKKNLLKAMLGLDWYPGNDWNFSFQFADDLILKYDDDLETDENNPVATLNVSKKILRQTLGFSNMLYYGFNEKDIYDQIAIDYAVTDELHLFCGVDIFAGDEGYFGSYEDNSQMWFKMKYSF